MTGCLNFAKPQSRWHQTAIFIGTVPHIEKNADKFTDWADLDKASVTVAATLVQPRKNRSSSSSKQNIKLSKPARDFQEVLAGRADAYRKCRGL